MCGEIFSANTQIQATFSLEFRVGSWKFGVQSKKIYLTFKLNTRAQNCSTEESVERKIRILIAKPGLDGHDRGAKVIARGFRDAGFEVIYTGLHQTPEQIVAAAIQEDVDAIGLSSLAGAHDYLFPRVIELLKEKGATDIVVFGGGIVPEEDVPALTQSGVKGIFTPGTSIEEAVSWVRKNIKPRK
jgi:methylmalonyl-CoA mutase C-terminal domain/subunit